MNYWLSDAGIQILGSELRRPDKSLSRVSSRSCSHIDIALASPWETELYFGVVPIAAA